LSPLYFGYFGDGSVELFVQAGLTTAVLPISTFHVAIDYRPEPLSLRELVFSSWFLEFLLNFIFKVYLFSILFASEVILLTPLFISSNFDQYSAVG
jgi:hypothetical protein